MVVPISGVIGTTVLWIASVIDMIVVYKHHHRMHDVVFRVRGFSLFCDIPVTFNPFFINFNTGFSPFGCEIMSFGMRPVNYSDS